MVLSDRTIRRLIGEGRIGIDPFEPALMQPSSLDVRVDRYFRVFRNSRYPYIDVKARAGGADRTRRGADDEAFILHPGEFVLGSTLERVTLPDDLVARLEGKSSLGRLGLLIHSTAGFIDPGWDGHVTLELSNVANLPITIYPGMKIGQLSFVQLTEPAERPYGSEGIGSKYQGQRGPTPSRYWQNFQATRLSRLLGWFAVRGLAATEPGEKRCQIVELVLLVARAEQVVDLRRSDWSPRRGASRARRRSTPRGPPAGRPGHEARSTYPALLETVEQSRHPRSREEKLSGEIDPPQPPVGRLPEA